jgi:16S rRNA (adenine1518-N6/adenine1519-N6)-dimethyltransferase
MTVVRAKKSLGQNFLVDASFQRRIIGALELDERDHVIEIGPGTGALTSHIVETGCTLVAVELDDELATRLESQYATTPNVRIVRGDVLKTNLHGLSSVPPDQRKIVGNIPYNITSPLLFRLLERAHRPERLVVMVQKEVADRILAPPGEKAYGALSVGVRSVAHAERLFNVPRGAFRPAPDVDSSVLLVRPIRPHPLSAAEEADLRTLTRAAFSWRRKQFQKTLRSAPDYALTVDQIAGLSERTGLDLEQRPETFEPGAFIALARALRQLAG